MPRPVASLARQVVVSVSAAKHHTAAVTAEGDLYTWGANRHCQLGYSIDTQPTPRRWAAARAPACQCHAFLPGPLLQFALQDAPCCCLTYLHSYMRSCSQRSICLLCRRLWCRFCCRIASIRVRWAAVAAANKHTAAVTDGGAVYAWGDNSQGQLGYGTSDSAANATPRIVEAMKVGFACILLIF